MTGKQLLLKHIDDLRHAVEVDDPYFAIHLASSISAEVRREDYLATIGYRLEGSVLSGQRLVKVEE